MWETVMTEGLRGNWEKVGEFAHLRMQNQLPKNNGSFILAFSAVYDTEGSVYEQIARQMKAHPPEARHET